MPKRTKTSSDNKRKNALKVKQGTIHKQSQTGKKNGGSAFNKGKSSSNPYRADPSGGKPGSQFRTRATINRLNMYKAKPDMKKMKARPTDPQQGKIHPDRKWFGNVRTADQKELDKYRKALAENTEKTGSGFSVMLKAKKLPLSLVKETYNKTLSEGERLLQVSSFQHTFGPASQRKRPNMKLQGLDDLMANVEEKQGFYEPGNDKDLHKNDFQESRNEARHAIFEKGLSKRIWEELYKVIDSSDVLIYVLDARNPNGTRTRSLEEHLKKNCPNKHLVFVLNKCDLVPTSVTQKWVKYLQNYAPTLAFQASITNSFGKGSVIQLLKQFDMLHKEKKSISVGFIGYPNVGKSSVINTLMKKACCKVAPIPGETKVWQYITLTKRIYLIDCPGIVYDQNESDTDKVLKGVVRAEKIPDPESYIQPILDKVDKKHITDIFGILSWVDAEDFIGQVAEKTGKLKKGGEPDINNVCKSIIFDWQRGNIPFFSKPPSAEEREAELEAKKEKPVVGGQTTILAEPIRMVAAEDPAKEEAEAADK